MKQLLSGRRMDRMARRIAANCWDAGDGWGWARFDELVSDETGVVVQTVLTDEMRSGEITGTAVRHHERNRAWLLVPLEASLQHQIHIASHEAWHLIAGHECCRSGAGEAEAEEFGRRVGLAVSGLRPPEALWYRLVGVV